MISVVQPISKFLNCAIFLGIVAGWAARDNIVQSIALAIINSIKAAIYKIAVHSLYVQVRARGAATIMARKGYQLLKLCFGDSELISTSLCSALVACQEKAKSCFTFRKSTKATAALRSIVSEMCQVNFFGISAVALAKPARASSAWDFAQGNQFSESLPGNIEGFVSTSARVGFPDSEMLTSDSNLSATVALAKPLNGTSLVIGTAKNGKTAKLLAAQVVKPGTSARGSSTRMKIAKSDRGAIAAIAQAKPVALFVFDVSSVLGYKATESLTANIAHGFSPSEYYDDTIVTQSGRFVKHNNWAAFGDVVDALVDLGLFDAA